ncbi:MAG: cyanophycinase [Bacteroidota bacterium]
MNLSRLPIVAMMALVVSLLPPEAGLNASGKEAGHLLIIGGGTRTPEMMDRFITLADGRHRGKIIVLPMASSEAETTGMEQVEQFRAQGVKNVDYIILNREQASDPAAMKMFEGVTGVFLSGGDQSRLTAAIGGTPVHDWLKTLYRNGGTISGTSAGAAVMSKVMITGDEILNTDSSEAFVFMKKGNIKTTEGFGFLEDVIIDQHFVRRKRHNRLLSLVMENPRLLGVGIDEATCIVVTGDEFEVLGERTVVVYDASNAGNIRPDKNGNLSATNIVTHILLSGDKFHMITRLPIIRKSKE